MKREYWEAPAMKSMGVIANAVFAHYKLPFLVHGQDGCAVGVRGYEVLTVACPRCHAPNPLITIQDGCAAGGSTCLDVRMTTVCTNPECGQVSEVAVDADQCGVAVVATHFKAKKDGAA